MRTCTADQKVRLLEENTGDALYSLSVTQFYDTLADLDVKCHRRNEKKKKKSAERT